MRHWNGSALAVFCVWGAAACGEGGGAGDGAGSTTTTESGLVYEVLHAGDGPSPAANDQVVVHYRGTLTDGTQFDSSYDRGQPAVFSVGGLIPGFAEALQMMSVGSHVRVTIPPELAYGEGGMGSVIGPNETLIFEIELQEIIEG